MEKKFSRIIQTTQSRYKVNFEKKTMNQQCSYNLPLELEEYLKSFNALIRETPPGTENNVLYGSDYRVILGNNILAIIGETYNNQDNKVVFTHTEGANGTSKKLQLKKTDFASKNNESYAWFIDLYNKNIEGMNFFVIVNDTDKSLFFDLELTKELFAPTSNQDENNDFPTLSPNPNRKHSLNTIIYGAPGTGKTYSTANYALSIINDSEINLLEDRSKIMDEYKSLIKSGRIVFTTFHQNYGYEDFIQGLRPTTVDGGIEFTQVDGILKKIANQAINDKDNNYVMIIDEINRGNISKIFGELITLIEEDKRWGEINELSVSLPSGDLFAIPNNLYILGTMNSADKSISLIDAALRRRFKFIEVAPDSNLITDLDLKMVLENINKELYSKLKSTDLLVGHSYFINKTVNDLENIMNDQIIPLLYEYFFDNKDKVKEVLKSSIDSAKYNILESDVKRLKISKI